MLSRESQKALFERYVNKRHIRESIQKNFSMKDIGPRIAKKECFSNVVYIDITSFSNKVKDMYAKKISDYLDEYYSVTLPIIYKYSGQIDKIMGDGIIVIFSHLLTPHINDREASDHAFHCSKEIIEELYLSEYESKAAIGSGILYFCKTGIKEIYEEYTAIGRPLTLAHRLESNADKNQILTLRTTALSGRILDNEDEDDLKGWDFDFIERELKGIGNRKILVSQY